MRWKPHLVVTFGVLATFARAVPYPLQVRWDDGRFLIDDPLVHEVSWRSFVAIFARPHFQAYHPLHLLSYWLDVPWTHAHAPTLHAVNLTLWALAANLLFVALRQLELAVVPATLTTLAFALHPVQVEAVSWATGRKDVLAALFAFAALLFHLRARAWGDRNAWLARASFACAALSKTTALPWPAVLWLVDVCLRGERPGRALRMQLPSLALACGLGPWVLVTWSEHDMLRAGVTPGGAVLRVANTLAHQFATAIWPGATAPMYSTRAVGEFSAALLLPLAAGTLGFVAPLALLASRGVATRASVRRLLFAPIAFAVVLAPVSNAVPMVFPWQDRYLSLPLFALAFAFGAWLNASRPSSTRGSTPAPLVLGVMLVLALGARTVQYQGAWSSELRLWGHAARTQPAAYYAWMKLGEVRREAGDLDGAIRAYSRMLVLEPSYKLGYAALCQAAALRDERIRHLAPTRADAYARALHAALDDADALRALAAQMLASGHLRTLEIPLARALDLSPFPDDALERAATSHFRAGRPTLGLFYLRRMRVATKNSALLRIQTVARAAFDRAPVFPQLAGEPTQDRSASAGHAW